MHSRTPRRRRLLSFFLESSRRGERRRDRAASNAKCTLSEEDANKSLRWKGVGGGGANISHTPKNQNGQSAKLAAAIPPEALFEEKMATRRLNSQLKARVRRWSPILPHPGHRPGQFTPPASAAFLDFAAQYLPKVLM